MRVNYGEHYKVTIHFNQEVFTVEEIAEIINHNFYEEDILSCDDYDVTVRWDLPPEEGIHEIENALFYMLKNGEYGMFSYEDVTAYDEVGDTYDVIETLQIKQAIEHGEHIGYYRVNHLVGPPKSEEFRDQIVEIRATGNMKIYDPETNECITSFVPNRYRLEVVMLRAGDIPSEEFLRLTDRNRNKIRGYNV